MAAIGSLFDDMTLIITESQPQSGALPLPENAQVIPLRMPVGQNARRKLSVVLNLPEYLPVLVRHARNADVVHVPLPGDIPFLGMIVALMLRKHLIARYGGSWFSTSETTFMNRFTRWLMRVFAGGRNVMLATGEQDQSPGPGMHWVYVTALTRRELAQINPVLGRGLSDPPQLAYVGRLSPEKGIHNLIKAVILLKRDGFRPLPHVAVIGDGPQRGYLGHIVCEANCEQEITFTGQLDRYELTQQLLKTDFCVQPSLSEGLSKAWFDAMAHGLPVLSSDVGAARSVIGQNGERGWIVPPGDVPRLAQKLREILTVDIDWPTLRLCCRSYVEGRTLEDWAETIGRISAAQWGWRFEEGKLSP